ncbi:hypothetical protein CAI21_08490 [Alkalilimnicola ehrlichii]|uniref:Gp5/Type VI secretion system Vgr protein OB-fold domain-containing protein n=1 Tax=Alkalilimnicola ehrlichii TaxID=351052 RepID=A0A3E0WVM4_9GAMM|nr:type VI secretion system tip protein TssI/VgrG [Alkalilimnicola ehrlichii]RFA29862.1 hypothetical protein CAI21_08490 [Alkalilimnicola ehrlichii]RFA36449.1 hypothetical protein CAL65_10750 [Alkalilimnicola ehrlichii]
MSNTAQDMLGRVGASTSHYELDIQQVAAGTFTVTGFKSQRHVLSDDYCFIIEATAPTGFDGNPLLGSEACLSMRWSGQKSRIHGVISKVNFTREGSDGPVFRLELSSPLWRLKKARHNRVFLDKTVEEIVTEVLEEAGIGSEAFEFELNGDYPQREYIVQFDESDYDFISRQLAFDGVFFGFEQTERRAVVLFADDASALSERLGMVHLPYVVQSGQDRLSEAVFQFSREWAVNTANLILKDSNDRTPDQRLEVETETRSDVYAVGTAYLYGEHFGDDAEGQRLAKLRQELLDWQRDVVIMRSDCRGLMPGRRLSLSDCPERAVNGDWLVIAVEHSGDQNAAQAYGGDAQGMTYENTLHLIRAGTPYRPPVLEKRRETATTFHGQVETAGGDYAHVDEDGRYRIRLPFDLSDRPDAEASHPVRLMQPYGGGEHGIHFPLHAGTEVLVGCLNGDLDRPLILGALNNANTPSPVTAANRSQNVLRTWGGNELVMDDRLGEERIELFTRDRENILTLDATEGAHKLRMASEKGDVELYAGRNMLIESGENQTVEVGADQDITVEQSQRLMTKEGEIEYQAATDFLLKADENVRVTAENQDLELDAGQDLVVQTGNAFSLNVADEDIRFLVEQGDFALDSAGAITVKGQGNGNIHIGQSGGAIEITADGNLTVDAPKVEITGGNIAIKGQNLGEN